METVSLDEAVRAVPDAAGLLETVAWFSYSAAILGCALGCYIAAKFFSEEAYLEGKTALVGAGVCGLAPSLAKLFIFNGGF